MDLKALRYFVTVAEEMNITRAADKLKMSQPPLSIQMKNLEHEFGISLFIRGKRNLRLTEPGKLLYSRAKQILFLSEKTRKDVFDLCTGETGTVLLGLEELIADTEIARLIKDFQSTHPNVRFEIINGSGDDLLGKLRSGVVDFAFITLPCDPVLFDYINLGTLPVCAYIGSQNHLYDASGSKLDPSEILNENIMLPAKECCIKKFKEAFNSMGKDIDPVCIFDNSLYGVLLASCSSDIAVCPKVASYAGMDVCERLLDCAFSAEYAFVWNKDAPLARYENDFIEAVRKKYDKDYKECSNASGADDADITDGFDDTFDADSTGNEGDKDI